MRQRSRTRGVEIFIFFLVVRRPGSDGTTAVGSASLDFLQINELDSISLWRISATCPYLVRKLIGSVAV
jgi:hypothetical protein